MGEIVVGVGSPGNYLSKRIFYSSGGLAKSSIFLALELENQSLSARSFVL
jgi:hypothetical protein